MRRIIKKKLHLRHQQPRIRKAAPNGTRGDHVLAPPPSKLQFVTVDLKTSALLVLDMEVTICNNPRCIASISNINRY